MGMRWWRRWKAQHSARPEGAHVLSGGGVWLSFWRCPHGAMELGTPNAPPARVPACVECWDKVPLLPDGKPDHGAILWTCCDGAAATTYLHEIGETG